MTEAEEPEITEVNLASVRPRFVVAPGRSIYIGRNHCKPGDEVVSEDQSQMNAWIESGDVVPDEPT